MTAAELLNVTEVERLALGPGDMLVFKCPMRLTDEEYAEIGNRFRESVPGMKVIVLEGGADISVLKRDAGREAHSFTDAHGVTWVQATGHL